jgi:phage/plasmid primase-like uncharacterized protein
MEDYTISKFDRAYSGLIDVNAVMTRATTIEYVQKVTGEAETFIVQTIRNEDGDNIVLKFVDKDGNKRLILPPRVANIIASQRDALTARRRSAASKLTAQARADRGELPGFMLKKA